MLLGPVALNCQCRAVCSPKLPSKGKGKGPGSLGESNDDDTLAVPFTVCPLRALFFSGSDLVRVLTVRSEGHTPPFFGGSFRVAQRVLLHNGPPQPGGHTIL